MISSHFEQNDSKRLVIWPINLLTLNLFYKCQNSHWVWIWRYYQGTCYFKKMHSVFLNLRSAISVWNFCHKKPIWCIWGKWGRKKGKHLAKKTSNNTHFKVGPYGGVHENNQVCRGCYEKWCPHGIIWVMPIFV
jgi:hypothetical protein